MKYVFVVMVMFVTVLVVLLGASIGVAFLLRWILPAVGMDMALLIAVIAVGLTTQIFWRFLNVPIPAEESAEENQPPVYVMDREFVLPRRQRKRR